MRKLLYAFVFASILVLAGFTSFASENEPGDGGTVPEEGYTLWLPVVRSTSSCVVEMEISSPAEGTVFQWGESIPGQFRWKRLDDGGGTVTVVVNLLSSDDTYVSILAYWGGVNNVPNPVNWDLYKILESRNFSETGEYRIHGSAMCPDNQRFQIERRFYLVNESD